MTWTGSGGAPGGGFTCPALGLAHAPPAARLRPRLLALGLGLARVVERVVQQVHDVLHREGAPVRGLLGLLHLGLRKAAPWAGRRL